MKKIKLKNMILAGVLFTPMLLSNSALTFADETGETGPTKPAIEYKSNGMIQFAPDDNPEATGPVDPINPNPENSIDIWDTTTEDHKPVPGTGGPLSLDYISGLDFGNNKITNKTITYYANPQYQANKDKSGPDLETAMPNYIQVTDKRGTNAGWSLSLKQVGQFKNEETLNKELTGAEISFSKGEAVSIMNNVKAPDTFEILNLKPNESVNVMAASKDAGAGTWVDRFGTVEEMEIEGQKVLKNKAISLTIPGTTPKDAVKYETKLLWTLSDVPNNK